MPTSFWGSISDSLTEIINLKPTSVLEIGVGFGSKGHLIREYLDVWSVTNYKKESWLKRIDGVEIFEPYINEGNSYYYNTIYKENIVTLIDKLPQYDLIVMMDVLEHIERKEAEELLQKIYKKSKYFLLQIPLGDWRWTFQGDNKHESHISMWNKEDFITYKEIKVYKFPYFPKDIGLYLKTNE